MEFVDEIRSRVSSGRVRASDHAAGRLQEKDISYRQLVGSLPDADVLETYPDYRHGACFLARHVVDAGKVAHGVWGMSSSDRTFAVLVTAYWPDLSEWDSELRTRL